MAAAIAHRSPTVVGRGPKPCCHRLFPLNRQDAFVTLLQPPMHSRPLSVHATLKPLSFRPEPCSEVTLLQGDSILPTAFAGSEGDPWQPLFSFSRILVAAVAFGCSWSLMLLLPEESGAASGGRMGGRSFDSSSTRSSGSGSSSSHSSLGSSSRTSSSPPTSYSSPASRPYTGYHESGFSLGSQFRSFEHESGWVASVTPATHLYAPVTVHSWTSHLSFLIFAGVFGATAFSNLWLRDSSTILKLQVGLLGSARSLQEDLDKIANISDPSTKYGLYSILTETILSLLRHQDYFSSGSSNVNTLRNIEHCEEKFNQISTEERAKIDEETLVNTINIRSHTKSRRTSNGSCNEYIVVTILMAAEGKHRLPVINGRENLEEALNKLASIHSNKILALEVLWTPQDVNDILTEQELMVNYPLLRPL